jgi:hypothetical protein
VTGIGLRREDDGTQRRCSDQTRSSTSASRSAIRRLVRLSRAHLSHSGSVSAISKAGHSASRASKPLDEPCFGA